MPDEPSQPSNPPEEDQEPGGFLVRKCFVGEGFQLDRSIEIRVSKIIGSAVYIAVRAPKNMKIRRAVKA